MAPEKAAYTKHWSSIPEQLKLLESRGLVIEDEIHATSVLRHINYFRFSGYCLAFESQRHEFAKDTTFGEVWKSYLFDVALRDLIAEALEVIEVDMRANVAFVFGSKYGAFGHTILKNFRLSFRHNEWTEKLHEESQRSSELFIEHFKTTYREFPNLPCWIATEVMSFGMLSKMYAGLLDQCQSPIAMRYNLQKGDLESALHHLSYIRNLCAHHCRLWDRQCSIEPRLPHGAHWTPSLIPNRKRVFVSLLLIYRMLKRCPLQDRFAVDWRRRINEMMKAPPNAKDALKLMGMTDQWYRHPLWS